MDWNSYKVRTLNLPLCRGGVRNQKRGQQRIVVFKTLPLRKKVMKDKVVVLSLGPIQNATRSLSILSIWI